MQLDEELFIATMTGLLASDLTAAKDVPVKHEDERKTWRDDYQEITWQEFAGNFN